MEANLLRTTLEFKHLRTLVAIAEAGSISKAAKALYIAQPALSNQLQQLELILCVELFVRTSKGVQLTEAGERFLIHARSILKYASHAISELQTDPEEISGSFTIGCANSLADSVGSVIMKSLKHRYPNIVPSLQAFGGIAQQESVMAAADFCITYSNISIRDAAGEVVYTTENKRLGTALVEKVGSERFLICRPASHDVSPGLQHSVIQQELSLDILERMPICLFHKDQPATKVIDWLAEKHGLNVTYYGFANSTQTILDLVVSEQCITLLPSSVTELSATRPNLSLHPLRDIQIERDIVLCQSDNLKMSDTTRLVKDLVKKVLESALPNLLDISPPFKDIMQ